MTLFKTLASSVQSLTERQIKIAFRIMALCVFGGAVNHIICVFVPSFDPTQSLAEHIFWVAANAIAIYFILNRTEKFLPILLIWTLQQWYFHGSWFIEHWRESGLFSLRDLSPVLFMPVLLIAYWWDLNRQPTVNPTSVN